MASTALRRTRLMDGNEAAASVAYRSSEVIAIYPITPSSTMGELADEWAAGGKVNLWGVVPSVTEMQSEGGAAGAVHGALQAGALSTTFTASQGLLLMIPNMYKIAGELTPFVMHVSARTLATHALSIFGDHSDVMACRQTGFAMLCSGSVQEAHDLACIAHAATLKTRIPFLHFFDGFRTSHEIAKIDQLLPDELRRIISDDFIAEHRARALTPDHPVLRGTAQNPDTFFQAREACNRFYDACPKAVAEAMEEFRQITGRRYRLFDYVGHPTAERVIVMMGSGAEAAHETVEELVKRGERVGLVKVRLYRPFDAAALLDALPIETERIAVLDRTKEPGSVGEPLYQDVVTALTERMECPRPLIVGGRYGLSSKEFTPAMAKAVLDELDRPVPRQHFTVGITDDVTRLSLEVDPEFDIESDDVKRAIFFGLGADGTVGANKNSIKIIGEETDLFAQGYFVYDSKKSGAMTVSHLRFGPRPIRSSYLIRKAHFVACHQYNFLEKLDVLEKAAAGATFLLNSPYPADETWQHLPREVQQQIIEKKLRFYVIDAYEVARMTGMGRRINTIMQTCFFAISGVLQAGEAIAQIKKAIEKTYAKKGQEAVQRNFAAVDETLRHLHEVQVPQVADSTHHLAPLVSNKAPDLVKRVTAMMLAGKGDLLPVSAFPIDGTWPTSTSKWEKRAIAQEVPVWDPAVCIQCNKCAMACPHAAIRAKVCTPEQFEAAPETMKSTAYKGADLKGMQYMLQVAPEDCTGCTLCVAVCPARNKSDPKRKAINMSAMEPLRSAESENFDFFLNIPEIDRRTVRLDVKGSQLLQPLFEFSGACSGCGETPYVKLLTQLFGDRTVIANATGCSSIYGGNLPTTPYCINSDGRGPAWSNSLFEDNAEFGLGLRLAIDKHADHAKQLLGRLSCSIGENLVDQLLKAEQATEADIAAQRERVLALRTALTNVDPSRAADAARLGALADYLVRKNVWILGGDGWAYDIGFGGLDHVLASGHDINVLVMDTEVYSNTGGQQSKATPPGAAAKFAVSGKATPKKDLGRIMMTYNNVYVAQVAFGAKDTQTVKAFLEAESYKGPSLIIAYSHCIAHGYDLQFGCDQQKLAIDSGYWPLYRFDPRRRESGDNPFQLDSTQPKIPLDQYMRNETRFRIVQQQDPERFKTLSAMAQEHAHRRYAELQELARPLAVSAPGTGNGNANRNATAAPTPVQAAREN